ncbi:MAG: FAD-dependent thymidylate synthase [Dysgonomonas sp.]
MDYFVENFTQEEKAVLNRYFTNTDKPVFGLVNLPEAVKGALFARYSRSEKSLRRLFLDEFYKDGSLETSSEAQVGMERASDLYDKMILLFGDDSVAQLGGAHVACEQVSNILAKVIEKGRIASYLEQSTRYVFYNQKQNGKYKYIVPEEIKDKSLRQEADSYLTELFDVYSNLIEELQPLLKKKYPKGDDQSVRAWESTIKAKACDIARGLLPGATKTNLGVFATGQSFEYLLVKMFASENEEVRQYGQMMLGELRKIIPSFLTRVDLEDRGKLWSNYLSDIHRSVSDIKLTKEISADVADNQIRVSLTEWDDNALDKIVEAVLYEYSELSDKELCEYVRKMSQEEKVNIYKTYVGKRQNRRHKPGRALESVYYRFDILSDYGAFRDIQRHRMLTIDWQRITPHYGYVMPYDLEAYSDLKAKYMNVLEKAKMLYPKIAEQYGYEVAQYIIPFAYKMRYSLTMNLREAFHLIELRSQKQGHPSYRKICLDMIEEMKKKAKHDLFVETMNFVDYSPYYDLSREDSEKNIDKKMGL